MKSAQSREKTGWLLDLEVGELIKKMKIIKYIQSC